LVYRLLDESQGRSDAQPGVDGAVGGACPRPRGQTGAHPEAEGLCVRPDIARLPLIRVQTETGTFNLFSCVNFVKLL
jgi:hypothetical protein